MELNKEARKRENATISNVDEELLNQINDTMKNAKEKCILKLFKTDYLENTKLNYVSNQGDTMRNEYLGSLEAFLTQMLNQVKQYQISSRTLNSDELLSCPVQSTLFMENNLDKLPNLSNQNEPDANDEFIKIIEVKNEEIRQKSKVIKELEKKLNDAKSILVHEFQEYEKYILGLVKNCENKKSRIIEDMKAENEYLKKRIGTQRKHELHLQKEIDKLKASQLNNKDNRRNKDYSYENIRATLVDIVLEKAKLQNDIKARNKTIIQLKRTISDMKLEIALITAVQKNENK